MLTQDIGHVNQSTLQDLPEHNFIYLPTLFTLNAFRHSPAFL